MKAQELFALLCLEDFLDISTDAVIATDQDQRIFLFNKSAEKIFGYTHGEIVGQSVSRLIPERYIRKHHAHMERFAAGPDVQHDMAERLEIAGLRKDGGEFPAEASIAKITRQGTIILMIFLRDITRRKRIEQDLYKWAQAFENAEWGVAVGKAGATVLQTMNPAFARMYGYSLDELIGKPIEDVYAPEDRPKLPGWIQQAHESGHITYEARHLRKDGTSFPALVDITAVKDAQGEVLYRVVNVLDITERKIVEEALKESEERYASMIAAMEEGIVLQDADGKIFKSNTSSERILGMPATRMLGRTWIDPLGKAIHEDGSLFTSESNPAMITLRTGKPSSGVVMGIQKPDGSRAWISVNTQPLFHPGESRPYSVLSSFSDITERLQMYQLLEQRVEKRTLELSALLEVTRNVASTMELAPLLTLILTQLKIVVDYTGAGIAIQEGDHYVLLDYYGPTPRKKMVGMHFPSDKVLGYQEVVKRKAPVIIDDLWGDAPLPEAMREHSQDSIEADVGYARSWLGLPMIVKNKLIGILRLDYDEPNHFTGSHARLASGFAEQAAIAIEKSRLYEQAQALAALEERQRLARELHDSVSQALYGIGLGARTARTLLDRDPDQAKESIEFCLSLAEAGLAEMRALIFELRPESLEVEGLVAALTKQTAALAARYSIQVKTSFGEEPQVSLPVKESIYRIAQEAFNNIVKHSHASRVEVRLSQEQDNVILAVSDNGTGFDITSDYPGHLGLNSMRERAEGVNGKLTVQSEKGKGTQVHLRIPLAPKP